MRTLYLPAEHTTNDLAVASELAELFDSAELFVAWAADAYDVPEVAAEITYLPDAPAVPVSRGPRRRRGLLRVLAAVVRAR